MAAASVSQNRPDTTRIDANMLESLSTIMSSDAVQSLLTDMARDVRLRLDRLAEVQVAPGSLEMIAQDAHDLKSMGGNFGLIEMSEHAARLERAARADEIDSVRSAVPVLIASGRNSLAALARRPEYMGGGVA